MTSTETNKLRIALAQLNPTVGDIKTNVELLKSAHADAMRQNVDLILFPELFITGYPPEDLVLKPAFAAASRRAIEQLASELTEGPGILVGTIWPEDGAEPGKVYNAVVLIDEGRIQAVRYKANLPNYGVFDEKRVFAVGPMPGPISFRGVRLGVPICEDIWTGDVCECLEESGAEILLVPNGSPFDWKKPDVRLNIAVARVIETKLPLVYVNQLGGQDELVFDGASFVLNADASLAVQLPAWTDSLAIIDWTRGSNGWICQSGQKSILPEGDASAYEACMLGLRDYVNKIGFPNVVLGLSGGVDSALVAALAVDALGADRVHCVMLPYQYTSEESLVDAADCATALGMRYDIIPIKEPVDGFLSVLGDIFKGHPPDVTEENLQSRTRGTILMAISNKFGGMVVTTGNKSEMSVGYATIYGDMNGGFNPIKDLYKTEVFRISAWRNTQKPASAKGPDGIVIPENILTKPPSAELREGQTDQDNLPEYDVLDDILFCLIENEFPLTEIIARGHLPETVKRIEHLLYIAEYKRRQAAPGVKISSKSFGRDRRYPITNRFREEIQPPKFNQNTSKVPSQVMPRADGGDMG